MLHYWVAFNDYAFQKATFSKAFNKRKASTDHWMTLSVGSSVCFISLSQIRKYGHVIVEWYISDDKELYHKFHDNKESIENEMGVSLEWNELPNKKASRILIYKDVDFDNKDQWSEQFDWMMDMAIKMKKPLLSFFHIFVYQRKQWNFV